MDEQIAKGFETFYGIPSILEAINGSYIHILVPSHETIENCCQNECFSYLLQRVVDVDCKIWDYDFEWIGHIHDWVLFH